MWRRGDGEGVECDERAKDSSFCSIEKDLKGEIHKSSFAAILVFDPLKPIGQNIPLTNSRQNPETSTKLKDFCKLFLLTFELLRQNADQWY